MDTIRIWPRCPRRKTCHQNRPRRTPVRRRARWLPPLDECALLLDIDGTLLDLAPTPREVWVPPGLANTLGRLLDADLRRAGARQRAIAERYRSDLCARTISGRRRSRCGNAALDRQRSGRHPCPADGQGIEAPPCRHRQTQPGHSAGRQGLFAGAALPAGAACGEGDLRGGVADQGRSAECADRSAARKMRLRDQAFRLQQGDRASSN